MDLGEHLLGFLHGGEEVGHFGWGEVGQAGGDAFWGDEHMAWPGGCMYHGYLLVV